MVDELDSFTIFYFTFTIKFVRRRKTAIFFLILGICLIMLAVALNVGWVLLNLREVALLVFGIVFFALIITGLTLNTIFLVREIRRNEQQDAFLNAMTHELKTPIASIRLYLETLKMREVGEQKRQEFYNIMLSDSDRLLSTVEQVLQASRTREKSRRLNLSKIEINAMLEQAIRNVDTRYNFDASAIKFNRTNEDVFVSGDAAELQTVFANLLDNAVKYSFNVPKILVRIKNTDEKRIEVLIKDNGIGLTGGDLKKIFNRFYRAADLFTQGKKGTGLGLAIVRSVVKKHGGKVWAESKGEGKGTTFIVQLLKTENGKRKMENVKTEGKR